MMCPTSSASKQYMETGTEYVSIADDTSLASVQSLMLQLITFDLFGKPYVAPTASVAVKTANRRLKSVRALVFFCSLLQVFITRVTPQIVPERAERVRRFRVHMLQNFVY